MAFCNDVKNIIDNLDFRYHLSGLNQEYRQVFHFKEILYDYICPNPQGRCVARYQNANIHWLNGEPHRNPKNGPAVVWADEYKAWHYKGKRHRDEGPAIIYPDGTKKYFVNGSLHRNPKEGPAVERTNGQNEYWEYGKKST